MIEIVKTHEGLEEIIQALFEFAERYQGNELYDKYIDEIIDVKNQEGDEAQWCKVVTTEVFTACYGEFDSTDGIKMWIKD